jgi:type III restriction enzyme
MRPERDAPEIRFPRVERYRVELPDERIEASFDRDLLLEITPELTGAPESFAAYNISANWRT